MKRARSRMPRLRQLALVPVALALLAPEAAAAAGWLPFKYASPPKIEAEGTQVGVDGDGNVTAAWRNDPNFTNAQGSLTIHASVLPNGASSFGGPVAATTTTGVGLPQLAVWKTGGAVVAWERNTGSKDIVEGATRSLGSWGGTTELSDPFDDTAEYLSVELAPGGEGIVGWQALNSPRRSKVRLINGGNFAPAPSKTFETSPHPSNNEPDVAISPDGSRRFLLAHKYDLGSARLNIWEHPGIDWDSGVQIADPGWRSQVAVAANGEPVSVWMTQNSPNQIVVKRGKNAPFPIATTSYSFPAIAVGPPTEEFPSGMVVVAWLRFVDDGTLICCDQVVASVGDGTTMSPPIELSDEIEDVVNGRPQAAVGADGTAYVAWTRYDGSFFSPEASVRPPGGSFSAIADELAASGDARVTDIATGADGRAIVGFDQIDSEGAELYWRAATAIYVPPAPAPKGSGAAALPPPPKVDTTAPKLKLNLSRRGFAPGDKLNQVAVERGKRSYVQKAVRSPLKEGTRLLVSLDEPASLAIRVDKLGCFTFTPGNPARVPSKQCDKPAPKVQHRQASAKAGLTKLTYLGDWSGNKVKPGALYEFEVVATDGAGNSTLPLRVRFTLDGKPSANGF